MLVNPGWTHNSIQVFHTEATVSIGLKLCKEGLIWRDCIVYQCDLRQMHTNNALCSKCEHEYVTML